MSEATRPDELPVLETLCSECDGQGGDWSGGGYGSDWRRCLYCNGAGHVPTPFGQRVLALMRHNFRPMLSDARAE